MPDNLFDNFVGGKLNDHEAPVPDGLWDKLTERQFDGFIGEKLKDVEAPVPEGMWDKIADAQLDHFFGESLGNYAAPVPEGLWDKVGDGQFDQFISDKLTNYTAPVPAGLWEKIHPEEKDRKVIFWRLPVAASLLLAVLIGGAMGAYFFFRPQPKNEKENVAVTGKTATTPLNNSKTPESNVLPPAAAGHDNNTGAVTPGDQQPASNASDVSPAAVHPSENKNAPVTVPGSSTTSQVNGDVANTTVTVQNNKKLSAQLLPTISNSGHHTPFIPGVSSNDNNHLTAKEDLPPATAAVNTNTDEQPSYVLPAYQSNFLAALTEPSRYDKHNRWRDLSGTELTDNKHASQFKSNVICPTNRGGMNSDWLLEVYASPDLAFKSVSNNTASAQYLSRKDSSERMQVGFTVGARIVKPLTDNILLKTGVQYTQMNEKYVYRTENEIKTTTVVTVRTIIRAPGDTVVVSDTSSLQTIGYKNNTLKNRFRSIDVPVIIGYQFGDEYLKFGINAGVIFNMSSWYQGVVLDSSMAVVTVAKGNNMVYRSKIGLGLYAGLSVSKQLGEDMQVFFEPYFRYNLTNITSSQAAFNQRFSLGGLSVGLRFNLNRK